MSPNAAATPIPKSLHWNPGERTMVTTGTWAWISASVVSGERVGCANPVSRGEAVFVNESAEAVAAVDGGCWCVYDRKLPGWRIGRCEVQ